MEQPGIGLTDLAGLFFFTSGLIHFILCLAGDFFAFFNTGALLISRLGGGGGRGLRPTVRGGGAF